MTQEPTQADIDTVDHFVTESDKGDWGPELLAGVIARRMVDQKCFLPSDARDPDYDPDFYCRAAQMWLDQKA